MAGFTHYEDEVRALVARRESRPLPSQVVAFYGSSSIRMWASLGEDFFDVPVVNLGFGGSTLAACSHFFDRLVPPVCPRALICYAGENDIGDGLSPDAVVGSFKALHGQVASRLGPVPFAYLSVKPSPNRWQYIERIRDVNRRIAAEIATREESHFLDVFTPMLRDDGTPRRELWMEDGIHMNSLGYHVWWQVIASQRRRIGF